MTVQSSLGQTVKPVRLRNERRWDREQDQTMMDGPKQSSHTVKGRKVREMNEIVEDTVDNGNMYV